MVRKFVKELIQEWSDSSRDSKLLIFDGVNGIGKSVSLIHLVNLLNEMNWITIYIPNSLFWIGGYWHYEESTEEKGMYNQYELAVNLLSSIYELNSEKLKLIELNEQLDKTLGSDESITNVAELIEFAKREENLQASIAIAEKVFNCLLNQNQ